MLEKFIIHLKNTIFFKSVLYILFITILLGLLSSFRQDLIESIDDNEVARETLIDNTIKLYSIMDSKNQIIESCEKYENLFGYSAQQSCYNRQMLLEQLRNLGNKYNLVQPIDVNISAPFFKDYEKKTSNNKIKIRSYDILLKFATKDIATFLALIKEAYSLVPDNGMVVSVELTNQAILNPKIIYKLSTDRAPDLIYSKFSMCIREITINN
jgi:hypothetical protein